MARPGSPGDGFLPGGWSRAGPWGADKVALDAGLEHEPDGGGFGGIVLAHNVRTKSEVDEILKAAEEAGATVTKAAGDTFYGGYAGFFTDLDGHAWEVAYNPGFPIAADGSITIPDLRD